MDLLHINIFYQDLTGCLLDWIMHLFFQIQNLQLLVFCMDDVKYMATLNYFLPFLHCIIIKINHLYLLSISLSHTRKTFVPFRYFVILWEVCKILSSWLIRATLLISSVYTQCASLLNLCCNSNMILLFNKQSL